MYIIQCIQKLLVRNATKAISYQLRTQITFKRCPSALLVTPSELLVLFFSRIREKCLNNG